jgi:hypothetical protein
MPGALPAVRRVREVRVIVVRKTETGDNAREETWDGISLGEALRQLAEMAGLRRRRVPVLA